MLWEITDTLPSPILRDFHLFLNELTDTPSPLTPSLNLARKTLFGLNQKMSWQQADVTEKSDQPAYPLLHLFYHISLESGLFHCQTAAKKPFFEPNLEKIEQFRSMPPAAQYFFLLETYLQHCDVESLDPSRRFSFAYLLAGSLSLLSHAAAGEEVKIRTNPQNPFWTLSWNLGFHGLYFEYFGLWSAKQEKKDKSWPKAMIYFESLTLTPFGKYFFETLVSKKLISGEESEEEENLYFDETRLLPFPRQLHEYFADKFPDHVFSGMLPAVEEVVFRDGTYVFKISLHYQQGIWRKVALAARHTLEDLHFIIQEAFKFDDDHLYSFYLHQKNDRRDVYHHPEFEPPYADEAMIGELGLVPSRKFRYLFDFGDKWEFDILLEEILEGKKVPKEPKILERHGKGPKQYGDWE